MTVDLTRRGLIAGAGALAVGAAGTAAAGPAAATTDRRRRIATVVVNGKVFTATGREQRPLEAVAIDGSGCIVAVGRNAQARSWIGRGTEVIDAGGGTVMPGIHDGHMHPLGAARQSLNPSLQNATVTVAELQAILRSFLDASADRGPDAWLQVTDWNPVGLLPPGTAGHKSFLDALDTTRPIHLQGSDFHNSLVNSRALALAGITRSTPDPAGGEIVRDASGEPTGLLKDTAQGLVQDIVPPPSDAELQGAYARMAGFLLSQGVVAFMDAVSGPGSLATYAALQSSGKLLQDVTPALLIEGEQVTDPAGTVDWLRTVRREHAGLDRLHLSTIKVFVDGVMEFPAQTAALLEPYLDADGNPTAESGDLYVTSARYRRLAVALDAARWQMHSHAIGDAAVRVALDAYEAAVAAHGARARARRHTIAHLQLVHPRDVPRFGRLGVLASMQLQWAVRNVFTLDALRPYLGEERWARIYPAAAIARAGGELVGGSDWPVDQFRPFNQIATAVDRLDPTGDTTPLNRSLGISRAASLRMHTAGGARQLHSDRTGTVEVGKRADLVVLDRDLTRGPVGDIRGALVQHTLIRGEVVYSAGSAAARGARAVDAAMTAVERHGRTAERPAPHSACGH